MFAIESKIEKSVMKRIPTLFLQAVIVLIGLVVLAALIGLPLTEGRATNLDLFSIYADPFILYGYATSIAFFVALYKAFKLLGYIGQNRVFSPDAVGALKSIKYCAIVFSILIVMAGLYIRVAHHKDDDPAGFLAICMVTTFASIVVATAAAIFEKILQNAIDMKSENDLTI
jgi:cytochrome bd-type quinol oxidase subunit 2